MVKQLVCKTSVLGSIPNMISNINIIIIFAQTYKFLAMVIIESSTSDSAKLFKIDGLTYQKGLFKIVYGDVEETNSGLNLDKLKIGINYIEDDKPLMTKTLLKDISIDEIISTIPDDVVKSLNDIINFNSGEGSPQTWNQTLSNGRNTGGLNPLVNLDDAIEMENGSKIRAGSRNNGFGGGISRECVAGYEDQWENGVQYYYWLGGTIIKATSINNVIPDTSFDNTKGWAIGSIYYLENTDTKYKCIDNTESNAVWETIAFVPYSGATDELDLGSHKITASSGYFNIYDDTPVKITGAVEGGSEGGLYDSYNKQIATFDNGVAEPIYKYGNGSLIVLDNYSYIGINTETPTVALDVAGDIKSTKTINSNLGFISSWDNGNMILGTPLYNNSIREFKFISNGDGTDVPSEYHSALTINPEEGLVVGHSNDADSSYSNISLSNSNFVIASSNQITVQAGYDSAGLVGGVDYSANYNEKSFVQKSYTDLKTPKGVVNSTTVVLSSSALNSTYPTAETGFKVYCTSIIGGRMIYEKTPTSNQWIQYPVTTVS